VLAFGQRASLPLVPGMAEHALPLKLVGDALHIRNRLLQRLAHMELTADAAERWALGHVVVIGGGFSGVEVAGAVADFMRSAHRRHPLVPRRELRVTLLQDQARLLPELPPALGRAAERALRERGVDVRLGARAVRVGARFVWLADDTRLASATVLCTTGERAHALVEQLGLATQRGRIVTAADGSVPGHAGLWALGDCAATPNAADGQTSLPTAQFAVAQAEQMADNLLRHVEGLDTRAFSHRNRAMMATTGHHKGVARILGVPLTGLPAWLLWRAYYLARMPTFGRKLRIWVEWTSSLFFPVDVTHLRFTRTADVDTPASPR
jgi:NADH:ubiquinone reductase (H+-translocating)